MNALFGLQAHECLRYHAAVAVRDRDEEELLAFFYRAGNLPESWISPHIHPQAEC